MRALLRAGCALFVSLVLGLALAPPVRAHPLGFGVLELSIEGSEIRYALRVSPEEGERDDALVLSWPEGCVRESERLHRERDGTVVRSGSVRCAAPTGELRVEGISSDMSVLVRVRGEEGVSTHRLEPHAATLALFARPEDAPLASFASLGVTHALTGIDHLLFLLGMVFLAQTARRVALAVTAFTVGHALTLGLATFGAITVDVPSVELAIALSLVALAVELVERERSAHPPLGARHPALFGGAFGLLHGLGFATALADTGLLPRDRVLPLIGFHLGIELAQLTVVLAVLAAAHFGSARLPRLASYAVGIFGVMLVLERL